MGCPSGVVANVLDCDTAISKSTHVTMFTFELLPLGKVLNSLIHSYGLNSTFTVLLSDIILNGLYVLVIRRLFFPECNVNCYFFQTGSCLWAIPRE